MKYLLLLTTICFALPIEHIEGICITEQGIKAKCKFYTNHKVEMKSQDGDFIYMGKFKVHEVQDVNGVLEFKLRETR